MIADIGEATRTHAGARRAGCRAQAERLHLEDEALLDQVTNLVEWPSAVRRHVRERYLDLPPEVLVQEMKSHQRYFSLVDAAGSCCRSSSRSPTRR